MKKLFSIIAGVAVVAVLAGGNRANAADNNPAFDADYFESFKPSISQVRIPEPSAPEAVDKQGNSPEKSSGQDSVPVHGYTPQQKSMMDANNDSLQKSFSLRRRLKLSKSPGQSDNEPAPVKYRPYADYEKPGYLIMSSGFNFESRQAKLEMAKNLPSDGVLVIFADNPSESVKERILKDYESVLPRSRIKVISLDGAGNGFWARDGIPVPVLDQGNKLTVVDAKYYHYFEPDSEISRIFKTGLEKHEYYFEGGNFQANHAGVCMIVNNERHAKIPDDIFSGQYGCKSLIRLPFVDGIGHVDERARFVNEKTIVTDTPAYKDILEGKGFTVLLLPKPAKEYETYVNSLIMNDHVVVPVFGEATDAQALAVYEKLGLTASGGQSSSLSNNGQGSIHCITMTYPKVPVTELMKALGAKEL